MHSDHSEGFIDLIMDKWIQYPTSRKIEVVCSDDVVSPLGFTISCRQFVAHIADTLINSGEIAQRISENRNRPAGGPAALANLQTFNPRNEPQVVWSSGEVKVSAIRFYSHTGACLISNRHARR